jgi:hypothetical protein
MKAI